MDAPSETRRDDAPPAAAEGDRCPHCHAAVDGSWLTCGACGRPLAVEAELPPRSTLRGDQFEVVRPIGRGGFGITYEAVDHRLQRRVAVKELFPDSAVRHGSTVLTPPTDRTAFREARQRFLREARVLARFTDPGIVRVYEVFEEHNTAYMVMELLDGRNLLDLLRARGEPFTEVELLDVAARVAAALRSVHAAGVLHRDVNPSNIILTDDGRIVVIDFGLARSFVTDHTAPVTRVVTPGYAPLEQYLDDAWIGPPSDVYGLAASLYRLGTGRIPVPALERQSGTELPSPHRLNPAISKATSDGLLDGLELNVAHRPQTLDAFLQRLGIAHAARPPRSLLLDTMPPSRGGGRPGAAAPDPDAQVTVIEHRPDPATAGPVVAPPPSPVPPPPAVAPSGPGTPVAPPPAAGPPDAGRAVAPPPAAPPPPAAVPPVAARPGPAPGASTPAPLDDTHVVRTVAVPDADRPGPDDLGPTARLPAGTTGPAPGAAGPASAPPWPGGSGPPSASPWPARPGPPSASPWPAPTGQPPTGTVPDHVRIAPPSRWKLTVPLTVAVLALATAAPVITCLALVLLGLPLLATWGDSAMHHARRQAGTPRGWWERSAPAGALAPVRLLGNLLVSVLRALPVVALGVALVGLCFGLDRLHVAESFLDAVIRCVGLLLAAMLVVPARRGSPRFRTGVAIDDLTVHLFGPAGRLGQRGLVLWVLAAFLTAAAFWFHPELWPVPL